MSDILINLIKFTKFHLLFILKIKKTCLELSNNSYKYSSIKLILALIKIMFEIL